MPDKQCQILIVQTANSPLQWDMLDTALTTQCKRHFGRNSHEALQLLQEIDIDVIILEVGAADVTSTIDLLIDFRLAVPQIPVIIITDVEDTISAIKDVQSDIQGFFSYEELSNGHLSSVIEKALGQLPATHPKQEQFVAHHFVDVPSTAVTAQIFGIGDIETTLPQTFNELLEAYIEILDSALERLLFGESPDYSDRLQSLADSLGYVKAGPRDLVKLHKKALQIKAQERNPPKLKAYFEEGRMVMTELMGHLVNYYRRYYLNLPNDGPGNGEE